MPLTVGEVLNGRYRVVRLLGQGGFGAVYRAWDLQMEGACALKENLDTSPTAQAQFEREAKMLYKLRHPSLPRVFDHFIVGDQGQYLVMDYIKGEDLQSMLERSDGPLPTEMTYGWLAQVCDALDYLHIQDPPVIHRDLKPANIRITPGGLAALVDFGIAKVYDASKKTTVGARAVTPGYSPPEQYGSGGTDARSDVYALGATAYHLLTGRQPPDSMDVVSGVLPAPAPVHQLNPAVSPGVSAVIQQALKINREQRLGSAVEFKAGLSGSPAPARESVQVAPAGQVAGTMKVSQPLHSQVSADLVSGSQAAPAPRPAPKQAGRSKLLPMILVGAALIALLLVGIAAGALIFGGDLFSSQPRVTQITATPDAVALANQRLTQTVQSINETATAISINNPQLDGTEQMALIPAGAFLMGSEDGKENERPLHEVTLEVFLIDIHEATNERYAECVAAGACDPPGCASFGEAQYSDHPVVCVDWRQAAAYCEWRAARLPTEAEWEKAARGGLEGALYPWGDQAPVCTQGVQNGAQFGECGDQTVPVGGFSPNGYGLYDMAGNVWEWVSDWYGAETYASSPAENPQGPDSGVYRVLRGGSWDNNPSNQQVANRNRNLPSLTNNGYGFRCARSP